MTTNKPVLPLFELGYFLDGWADLVEGMGGKVSEIRAGLVSDLNRREMPYIQIREFDAQANRFSLERRPYTTATTDPGATTTIYVGKHGQDLYVAWRTFLRFIPNWALLKKLLMVGLFIGIGYGLIYSVLGLFYGLFEAFINSVPAKENNRAIGTYLLWVLGFLVGGYILHVATQRLFPKARNIINILWRRSTWLWAAAYATIQREFLVRGYLVPPDNSEYPAILLSIFVWFLVIFILGLLITRFSIRLIEFAYKNGPTKKWQKSYKVLIFVMGGFFIDLARFWEVAKIQLSIFWSYFADGLSSFSFGLSIATSIFLVGVGLLILGGLLIHRNPVYYLLVQPTQFDAEDISAMSLSVHKSVLRVLDTQGIDTSKLRIKQSFTGGRKGEDL